MLKLCGMVKKSFGHQLKESRRKSEKIYKFVLPKEITRTLALDT